MIAVEEKPSELRLASDLGLNIAVHDRCVRELRSGSDFVVGVPIRDVLENKRLVSQSSFASGTAAVSPVLFLIATEWSKTTVAPVGRREPPCPENM